jgi:hypothetical protein
MGRRKKSKQELEELTRTQVLNIQELENAAKYEKRTSKKPAVFFAVLGLLSISLGVSYPGIQSMMDDSSTKKDNVTEQRQEEEKEVSSTATALQNTLTCSINQMNEAEATTTVTNYTFNFSETNTLASFEKTATISVTTPVSATPASIVSLDTALANLKQTVIAGYTLETTPTASTTPNVVDGYTAKLTVDFASFNPQTLTALHTSNVFANVEFSNQDTKDTITTRLTQQGFTCQ